MFTGTFWDNVSVLYLYYALQKPLEDVAFSRYVEQLKFGYCIWEAKFLIIFNFNKFKLSHMASGYSIRHLRSRALQKNVSITGTGKNVIEREQE